MTKDLWRSIYNASTKHTKHHRKLPKFHRLELTLPIATRLHSSSPLEIPRTRSVSPSSPWRCGRGFSFQEKICIRKIYHISNNDNYANIISPIIISCYANSLYIYMICSSIMTIYLSGSDNMIIYLSGSQTSFDDMMLWVFSSCFFSNFDRITLWYTIWCV